MINQIKHNSPIDVLSQFNPIASLKSYTRKEVNEKFILPILKEFFSNKGGLDLFRELDSDKLKTEVEFVKTENFVKTYIYKEIIDEISKKGKGLLFKPKYVITFDTDLANFEIDEKCYPYKEIFQNTRLTESKIKYGVIRLGIIPILYYILLDMQKIIQFIKTLPNELEFTEISKKDSTEEEKRKNLFDTVIFEKHLQLRNANSAENGLILQEIDRLENLRQKSYEGQSGKLRVNLAWNTTDDLDLHIITPNGTIAFNNKTVENEGIIGQLDIDKNAGEFFESNPQENVNFNSMPLGLHTIFVDFYTKREMNEVPFTITIIPKDEEGRIFNKVISSDKKYVATFEYLLGELVYKELTE